MKRYLIPCLVFFIGFCSSGQVKKDSERASEIPWTAFRLLTESTVDPCPICAKMKVTEATGILVRKYKVRRSITSTGSCGFVKTAECGVNEFVLSCYKKREMYTLPGGDKKPFPLLIFKFHTKKDHLVGVSEADYTGPEISGKYNELAADSVFNGEIGIINFTYGDGPSFNIFMDKNQVVVHCRVVLVK